MAKRKLCFLLILTVMMFCPLISQGQSMNDYCQYPSSISVPVDPNVLFAVDLSGSMSWCAYTSKQGSGDCTTAAEPFDANKTYEGYFDPSKNYTLDSNGVYIESGSGSCTTTCTDYSCRTTRLGYCDTFKGGGPCSSNKYFCCNSWQATGGCGGNYLNYLYMRRIDILRWALTGGKLESCNNSIQTCDPEVYYNSQLSCDSNGCTLLATDGITKVKVPWARINGPNGGLLFQLKDLDIKPRIGVMFFQNSGVIKTVYVGDFTASASFDAVNPYKNVITSINHESPSGSTPTAPALWDVYNYFAQNNAQYGGPQPQTGSGNEFKNPLNRCFDSNSDGNCQGNEFEAVPCAKNFVVLMTDGQWNAGGLPVQSSCKINDDVETESPDPVVPAYYMHKLGFTNSKITPAATTHVENVFGLGLWLQGTGETALKNVAMYGSFDRSSTWPGGTSGYPQGICSPVNDCCSGPSCGKGSACTALPSSHSGWDKNGDGEPDTFFKADDAAEVKEKIVEVLLAILRHVASGSAVSILSSSEGSGANLLQAVYYPRKSFGAKEIEWTGELQNLWYYVDPYLVFPSIREDTTNDNVLNLGTDKVLEFFYDEDEGKTKARRYNTDTNGANKTYVDTILLEDAVNLWKAGETLFKRTSPRTVYTTTDGTTRMNFSDVEKSTLAPYLLPSPASVAEAEKIINYIRGTDQTGYRTRTVTINGITAPWRLGDIVDSSPRLQAGVPLNSYHKSAPDGYSDLSYGAYTSSTAYKNRNMSYIGANDGMLHAFKHGKLQQSWSGKGSGDHSKLTNPDVSTPLGEEVWAFIPKNCLPYLKFLADQDYCHLYYVDTPSTIFDASIGGNYNDPKTTASNSWRTILIGGMGLGGASKISSSSCTMGASGTCVKTPLLDPADSTKGLGYSSYFALDITDPGDPQVMWEFSDPDLGFSISEPAIVRIGDRDKNGKWYAIFVSGPTGPIDPIYRQFLGKSDQNLRIFVVDLKTGALERKIDTGITQAFGGSLYNATIDVERINATWSGIYSDDIIHFGYTQYDSATSKWTKGGVIRVTTKEDQNPANWSWSHVIQNIGPVTSAVTKLQDKTNNKLWLYFGTGRFYYRLGNTADSATNQQRIYGVQEPCYHTGLAPENIDNTCTTTLTLADLEDKSTDNTNTLPSNKQGWYIDMYAAFDNFAAERVITDPLATAFGAVFYTTYVPSTGICSMGGETGVWAVDYATGGQVHMQGSGITQVSTGAIHQLDLATVFTDKGFRRTPGPGTSTGSTIVGMPPRGSGLSILIGPKPIRRILHMKEK